MPTTNTSPKTGYATSAIDCPHCQRRAPFHGYRGETIETLGGPVTCNRAYYCGVCGPGSCPWDERVGITAHRLSPATERLATLCGAVADSFEKGAELL
ncbi:MAG: ISKra4 family transposase, partial [Planctomycetes bacterium]|nr:ISKra4 family transposase [Planctomycetota bacterium]